MRYLILIILTVISLSAKGMPLSFNQARELLYSNNLEIQAAREAVEIAKLELQATRGLRLPNIDFTGGYILMQRDIDIDFNGIKNSLDKVTQSILNESINNGVINQILSQLINLGLSPLMAADWSYTLQNRSTIIGGVSIVQPIYMGGRINAAIEASEAKLHQAEQLLRSIEYEKLNELVERYYGVVIARMALDYRTKAAENINRHLEEALELEREGVIAHSEVLYVQYKLSVAKREVEQTNSELMVAQSALQELLNYNDEIYADDRIFIVNTIQPIEYYKENAINLNPILQLSKESIAISEAGVKFMRADLLPEISALGSSTIFSKNLSNIIPRWSIGVGVQFKLFDGLAKERRYIASKKSLSVATSIVKNTEQEIMLFIDKEYYSAINSLQSIETINSSIEFAEAYLHTKREGFKEGMTTSIEVIDAELALEGAMLERVNEAYNFCKSLSHLLEASGLSDHFDEYRNMGIII